MLVLGGDVGGTNTRLAIFEYCQGKLVPLFQQVYASKSFPLFEDILNAFLKESGSQPEAVCIGVAGPVQNGRCEVTNLPWVVDRKALARDFSFRCLELVNDLEANAYGIDQLSANDFMTVSEGQPDPQGNRAVISAGTGLGEAGLLRHGNRYLPYATEGGHSDFGPRNPLQEALLGFMQCSMEHVSYEEILCGSGLERIYDFFAQRLAIAVSPDFSGAVESGGKAATVSAWAVAGKCQACVQSLDLYLEILGQEAGNLALKTMATGGIYLGGGIAAKLAASIQASKSFQRGFLGKGKMSGLLSRIPVRVILEQDTALLGAASRAYQLAMAGEVER